MAEEKKYLDYEGLKHLVEKLTDRIQAAGSGAAQGVYVAYVDTGGVNRICRPSDWSADMGTCCGVAVVENGRAMLVAPTMSESAMAWSGSSSDFGAYTADSINYASQDYAGRGNTEKAVSAGYDGENVGFGFCHAYSYGDVGPGKWWMPAMGELKAMRENLDGLGEALEAIGGDPIDGTVLWSSTQVGSSSIWTMNVRDGVASSDSTSGRHYVRPVSEWVWTEATGGGVTYEPEPQPKWYLEDVGLDGTCTNSSGKDIEGISFSLVFSDSQQRGDASEIIYDIPADFGYIGSGKSITIDQSDTVGEQVDRRWFLGLIVHATGDFDLKLGVRGIWDGVDGKYEDYMDGELFLPANVDMAPYDGQTLHFIVEGEMTILDF